MVIQPSRRWPRTLDRRGGRLVLAMGIFLAGVRGVAGQSPSPEELARFEREVRPVLVEACGRCHGPKKQEAGLRLDARDLLLRGGDSGAAIVPGDANRSLLLQVVRHEHEIKMPPDGKLRPEQIRSLEQWVAAGAPWPVERVTNVSRGGPITEAERGFWSFQPLQNAAAPEVLQVERAWSPVDRFVVREWERQGLEPVALADRRTLLRRVTIDLVGLPPTPAEIADFLADEGADALARVVDRLLASPRYGERYGRHWLDVVRYADTAGDGADYPVREAYRYRNYVIRAWNADKPFDQFLREQIAGDILARAAAEQGAISPDDYADQVIATGFLAVSKRFGYNINTEFQHLDIADAIEGLGRSVLGLSIGCARCHDHKYDPVNMTDYYSLYGIFASSQFSFPGGEEHKRPHQLVPLVVPAEVARRDGEKQRRLAALDAELKRLTDERTRLAARLPGGATSATLAFENQMLGQPLQAPWFQAGPNRVLAEAQSPLTHLAPVGTRGVRLESGTPNDGVRHEAKPGFTTATAPRLYFSLDFCNRSAPADARGAYRLYLGHGAIASLGWEASVAADSFQVRNGGQWERLCDLKPNQWYNLQLEIDLAGKSYSGRVGRPGEWIEIANRSLAPGWNGTIDTFFSDGIGHVEGVRPTRDFDNLFLQSTPLPDPSRSGDRLSDEQIAQLRRQLADLDAAAAAVKKDRDAAAAQPSYEVAYAVSEGKPVDVKIQKRGEPDRLGDAAPRKNLEVFGAQPVRTPTAGSGRLDLAEWLTRPDQPLTWRVIANRLWQHHFGAGIVRTSSDFGTRGELPSHPELLDYLARQLIARHGSLKMLQREMLLTRTYQLASGDRDENLAADPGNRWLWKHARKPLDAESIRDGMLEVSGDLNRSMAGAHPFPPTESWGFTIHYPFSAQYESPHRSVYLMVQRARKHPYLSLFDGADPNLSTSERLLTTTPTQALYLMNAPFVEERAVSLAQRLLREHATDAERVRWSVAAVTGRSVTDEELAAPLAFVARYRAAAAGRQPAGPPMTAVSPDVLAWTAFSRALMTSNAYLFVD